MLRLSLKVALPLSSSIAAAALVLLCATAGSASADSKDAGAPDAGVRDASASLARIPPDPTPMAERQQWVFDLRWDRGDVYLLEVHKVDMGAPHTTPRVMGRFALELFEGPTLIERVRFDFPMLGGAEPDAGRGDPPAFEPKLRSRIGVLFPATKRGTRLELWDRARNVRMPLPWPPTEGPAAADAGAR
ncbi:MAG: hypothetical protein JWP97_3200 [Labilithrix sp.]|nr:hypothetical protein [Labilithrix sp.]